MKNLQLLEYWKIFNKDVTQLFLYSTAKALINPTDVSKTCIIKSTFWVLKCPYCK